MNLRLTEHAFDVLAAGAFLSDVRGPQELLMPVVTELVTRLEGDAAVREVVAAREARRGERGAMAAPAKSGAESAGGRAGWGD